MFFLVNFRVFRLKFDYTDPLSFISQYLSRAYRINNKNIVLGFRDVDIAGDELLKLIFEYKPFKDRVIKNYLIFVIQSEIHSGVSSIVYLELLSPLNTRNKFFFSFPDESFFGEAKGLSHCRSKFLLRIDDFLVNIALDNSFLLFYSISPGLNK